MIVKLGLLPLLEKHGLREGRIPEKNMWILRQM